MEVEEAHYEDVIVGEVMITEEVEAVVEEEAAGPMEVVPEVVLMIDWLAVVMTEDHQAAELLPRRGEFFFELQTNHVKICALFLLNWLIDVCKTGVLEVLASIVGVQDTWQQIVLTREGSKMF